MSCSRDAFDHYLARYTQVFCSHYTSVVTGNLRQEPEHFDGVKRYGKHTLADKN